MTPRKTCVHCQEYPSCRNTSEEPYYGILSCGCTTCDCHAPSTEFTCTECGKKFTIWKLLFKHLDEHRKQHEEDMYNKSEDPRYTWGI